MLLALCIALPAWGAPRPDVDITAMVVFGDSLSDPGNAYYLSGRQSLPPYDNLNPVTLIPSAPYAKGGHHFSNGKTWIEQLGRELRLDKDTRPAFQVPGALNYAIGGSTARPRTDGGPFLGLQVAEFLASYGSSGLLEDAVVVIVVGGNDLFDALETAQTGGDPAEILIPAVQAIIGDPADPTVPPGITDLYLAGARKFLVGYAPDIGLTPAIYRASGGDPAIMGQATLLALGFNLQLHGALSVVQAGFPDIEIEVLDLFTALQEVAEGEELNADPDVTCITPGVPPFVCKRPDDIFFMDGIHPTVAGHAVFAREGLEALEALLGAP
jgi:phospholipase/lecithinase/hemolysin